MNRMLYRQLKTIVQKSRFYSNKLRDLRPVHADLCYFLDIPYTTKKEILDDQFNNPPFGSNLCVDKERISRIHKTSGTKSSPYYVAMTANDVRLCTDIGAKCFSHSGLRSDDVVVNCLNYCMWAGGYTDHQSLEKTGAAVIPYGVGNTKNLVKTLLDVKPSAIHCTPSYLSQIEDVLLNDFNENDPRVLGIRLGLFGAESGIQHKEFRNKIESRWGLKAQNANYGLSEVLSIVASEGEAQDGLQFISSDLLYPELIHPFTGEVLEFERDAVGELVLTNLYKEAQPLLRYRTGDLIRIMVEPEEKDSKYGFKFEVLGRSDDMFVYKGINVFVGAIEEIIHGTTEFSTEIFEVHISSREPVVSFRILVESSIKYKADRKDHYEQKLQDKIKSILSVSPTVKLVDRGELKQAGNKQIKLHRSIQDV